jgi:hypothetical protein
MSQAAVSSMASLHMSIFSLSFGSWYGEGMEGSARLCWQAGAWLVRRDTYILGLRMGLVFCSR